MLPQAKEIIVQSILAAWDRIEWRKNAIGIFGFDLMPDSNCKLWLLEVNKCPTMEYSTHVTRTLVPRFLEDLADLMVL
jgi:D-alanine-D-alanine ligase-like ATP-grasp enzyme